jgi:hypothetical protein
MSDLTRRDALGRLAAAFAAAGAVDALAAVDAHAVAAQGVTPGGSYAPKALTTAEYRTLQRLTDLIIPVDDGKPGALQAGVPEWIDTLAGVNAELKARYVAGLGWLNQTMTTRRGLSFVEATHSDQTALLDQIAYKRNASPELNAGIEFFTLARRMTVDGFYTSPIGMRDIYQGNDPRPDFVVPAEALNYVLARSPFKE